MKFQIWVFVILLVVAIFSTHRGVRQSRSEAERFFAIRVSVFSWLTGFVFLVALLFLPFKQGVLLLLPLFIAVMTIAKLWRNGRARLRREHELRGQFERAKRVN